MTTHHTLELERKVRQLGVLYYTEKPPEPAVMERVVATALASAGEGTRLRQPAKGLGRPPLV
jgi:hypothetical protein